MAKVKRAEVLASLKMVGERLSTSRPLPTGGDDPTEKAETAPVADVNQSTSDSAVESDTIADDCVGPSSESEATGPIEFAGEVHASLVDDIDSVGDSVEAAPVDPGHLGPSAAAEISTESLAERQPADDDPPDTGEDSLPEKEVINIWAPEMRMPTDPVPPIRPSIEALESYKFARSKRSEEDCVARAFQTIEQLRESTESVPETSEKPAVTSFLKEPAKPASATEPPAWIDPPESSAGPAFSFTKPQPAAPAEEVDWEFNFEQEPEGIGSWLPKRGLPAAGLVLTLAVAVCLAVFFISGSTTKSKEGQPAVKTPASKPASAGIAESNESIRHDIRARYDQLYKSRASDADAYMRLLTGDFIYTDRNGKTSGRSETESTVRKSVAFWKSVNSWATEVLDLSVEGDRATVTIAEEFENFFRDDDGKYGAKGARHQFKSTGMKFRDTWVKSQDGWKLSRSHAIQPATETVDGKPAGH